MIQDMALRFLLPEIPGQISESNPANLRFNRREILFSLPQNLSQNDLVGKITVKRSRNLRKSSADHRLVLLISINNIPQHLFRHCPAALLQQFTQAVFMIFLLLKQAADQLKFILRPPCRKFTAGSFRISLL